MKTMNDYPNNEIVTAINDLLDENTKKIIVEQIKLNRKKSLMFEYELVCGNLEEFYHTRNDWFEYLRLNYFDGNLPVFSKLSKEMQKTWVQIETLYEIYQMRKTKLEQRAVIKKYLKEKKKYGDRLNGKC